MMLCKTDRLMFKCHFKALSVLVFHLLLPHFSRGVSRLIGPSQPVIATLGDDIILPCNLDPAVDASGFTLEWTRPDLDPRFVHVWRDGVELVGKKHKSFEGRTSLFIDELKNGNISLKLSKVNVSDKGRYRCFIPGAETQSFAELVVVSGSVSSPVIKLAGVDRDRGGVVLQCESTGWYPEPEVFWLNSEGNLLSAGPTETVRGPDNLYTVSSRVTVEKRHNNNFTCRVQQKNINQTRETHIIVSDDFFMFPFCNSAVPIITGLAVILAGIVLILTIVLFVWRKNRTNKMRNHTVKSERGQNGNDNELQALSTEQKEGEEPLTTPTVLEKNKGGKKKTKNTLNQQLQEEQQKRKEAENRLKTMEQELEHMNKVENKHSELQDLHEEHQKKEEELQALKEKIETTNKELLRIRNSQSIFPWGLSKEDQQKKEQAENEVEKLKEEVDTKEKELKDTNEQIEEKQAEFQKLCDDVGMTKNNLPRLMEKLRTSKKDVHLKVIELKCAELQQTRDRLRNTSAELRNLEKELEKSKLKVLELQNLNKPSQEHDDPTVACQGSIREHFFVEFEKDSKYVGVKNIANEDQPMGCWELQIQVDDKQPIIYTFLPSFTLKAGETITIWPSDSGADHNPPTNLVLWKSWGPANKLLATLLCSSGQEMAKTQVNNTIETNSDHFK